MPNVGGGGGVFDNFPKSGTCFPSEYNRKNAESEYIFTELMERMLKEMFPSSSFVRFDLFFLFLFDRIRICQIMGTFPFLLCGPQPTHFPLFFFFYLFPGVSDRELPRKEGKDGNSTILLPKVIARAEAGDLTVTFPPSFFPFLSLAFSLLHRLRAKVSLQIAHKKCTEMKKYFFLMLSFVSVEVVPG